MSNNYKIGNSTGQISLEADIISIGAAASVASVFVVVGTDPDTVVAQSQNATGNIQKKVIGDYTLLKGKRLSVYTKITLLGDDAGTRATNSANVTGSYTVWGGDDGTQPYNNPVSTYQDPNVFLLFVVDLT